VAVFNLPNPMSQLPSADKSSPHADPSAVVVAEPGFEVTLHAFWNKNRGFILLLCGIILVGIIGREGWQYFSTMREKNLQEEYAQISDKPDRLAAFAETNSGHPLAGVAYLQIADRKFEAADFKEAVTFYTKAAGSLKNESLLGRAKLGSAISQVSSGDSTGGEAALKAISAEQTLPKAVRAEATYHLASLAYEAGKPDEVRKLVDDITKIDLGGPWSQRATMLLSNLQAENKSASGAAGFSVKPGEK
jgi:hypothetical protein